MANQLMTRSNLRFDGSLWVNLDIALRRLDQVIGRMLAPIDISIIEWYILRALYEQDGQHASELARAVGRAATSFTPNLDKLQNKGLIERRPDPNDRRAVHIYLTEKGRRHEADVLRSADEIDTMLRQRFEGYDLEGFLDLVYAIQTLDQADDEE
jgi:DNA-binding MarR family transcriptional regulator